MTRKFLGKTEGFVDNTERHFYQRMLKAYLKGKEYFTYGFEWVKRDQIMVREPAMFKVAQELKFI